MTHLSDILVDRHHVQPQRTHRIAWAPTSPRSPVSHFIALKQGYVEYWSRNGSTEDQSTCYKRCVWVLTTSVTCLHAAYFLGGRHHVTKRQFDDLGRVESGSAHLAVSSQKTSVQSQTRAECERAKFDGNDFQLMRVKRLRYRYVGNWFAAKLFLRSRLCCCTFKTDHQSPAFADLNPRIRGSSACIVLISMMMALCKDQLGKKTNLAIGFIDDNSLSFEKRVSMTHGLGARTIAPSPSENGTSRG